MRFDVGDIIELRDGGLHHWRHNGTLGKVIDLRTYHSYRPTHYLIKFTCYKIPHLYGIDEIDRTCVLYKIKKIGGNNMKCEKCGTTMVGETDKVYTSDPPMYGYKCPKCGNYQYSFLCRMEDEQ